MKPRARAFTRLLRQRGLAVVEFAMILPILLVLMFGVVEFGRAILTRQVMINLSRETANLASRGTALPDAVSAAMLSSAPLNLQTNGYVILTEVFRETNGNLRVRRQHAAGGRPGASHVGVGAGNSATLPATPVQIPPRGQSLFVAEVYYRSTPITPLGSLLNITIGENFYDVAFF